MSEENLRLAKAALEAWRDGTLGDKDLLDPDAEWVNPPDAVERGVRRGADAFIVAGDAVRAAFEDARIELERWIDGGDRVAAIGTLIGHGRESGVDIERTISVIWTVAGGRVIRLEWFFGRDAGLAVAEQSR